MTDTKPDHDIVEEEVRGYNGISVNKNDDDLNNEVNEHNNEAQNFEVDEENSMVDPESLEKFPEPYSVPPK